VVVLPPGHERIRTARTYRHVELVSSRITIGLSGGTVNCVYRHAQVENPVPDRARRQLQQLGVCSVDLLQPLQRNPAKLWSIPPMLLNCVQANAKGTAMSSSILASVGRMLWRYLEARGVDADALFKRNGLDPSLIHESYTRYPHRLLCKAVVDASVITRNENIGFDLARHYNLLDLNALGVAFLSSGSLIEALRRLQRYEAAVSSHLKFSITESKGLIHLSSEVSDMPGDAAYLMEDVRMSVLVDLCCLGLERSLDPMEIAFTYPKRKTTGDHYGVFRCPLKFSQPLSKISFNIADARCPFTAVNRALAISGDKILEGMINDLKGSDIISQVKLSITDNLPSGTPSKNEIAKQVFLSVRTLHRRLADEGTNFRKLVLEVRKELAEKYVADKDMSLAEISYMLGFTDISSFYRSFKQWTGVSPASFRDTFPA